MSTENIKHHIGADVYIREGLLKQGERIEKHTHNYDHFSILGSGAVTVLVGGVMYPFYAPALIEIKAGMQHEVLAMTDATWFCIHGTLDEIDDLEGVKIK